MKRALLLVLVAFALQAAACALFVAMSEAAYGGPRRLAEALELPLTWTGLVVAGPLALGCATTAAYLALRRARLVFALPVVSLLCLPALLIGAVATFTLACQRGWC